MTRNARNAAGAIWTEQRPPSAQPPPIVAMSEHASLLWTLARDVWSRHHGVADGKCRTCNPRVAAPCALQLAAETGLVTAIIGPGADDRATFVPLGGAEAERVTGDSAGATAGMNVQAYERPTWPLRS